MRGHPRTTPELPANRTAVPIPPGHAGALATLTIMRDMARDSALRPRPAEALVELARLARKPCPEASGWGLLGWALRCWMADAALFVDDPDGGELIRTPETMADDFFEHGFISGDCDDFAVLGASLSLLLGMEARYVAVALRPGGPLEHVWAEALDPNGGWVELDVTREAQGIPEQPPIFRRTTLAIRR